MSTITIIKEGARYVARFAFSYPVKDAVKAAGFKFDAPRKVWFTEKESLGEALMGDWSLVAFVARVNESRDAERLAQEASIVASRAAAADIAIPAPAGLAYLPFQLAGIAYCLDKFGDVIPNPIGVWQAGESDANRHIQALTRVQSEDAQMSRFGANAGSESKGGNHLTSNCSKSKMAREGQQGNEESNASTKYPQKTFSGFGKTDVEQFQERQWSGTNTIDQDSGNDTDAVGFYQRVSSQDERASHNPFCSAPLQSGLRQPQDQNGDRVGWSVSQHEKIAIERPQERRDSAIVKVDNRASRAHSGVLLADALGLGKTIQAIGVINAVPSIQSVLIICPASLKLNWCRELEKWLVRPRTIGIVNGSFPAVDIIILNYEQVAKYRSIIDSREWHMLCVDETHYLKNPKAQRTHAVFGSRDMTAIKAHRQLYLSGTPLLNRPSELWTLVHALDPEGLGRNWRYFHNRYCGPSRGWQGRTDYKGASHLDELQARLRASIMVRRMKEDVLKELPAKRRQVITLQPRSVTERDAIAIESRVVAEQDAKVAALRSEVERLSQDRASQAYIDAVAALRKGEAVAFTETSRVRHEVALSKVPQVIEHIVNCLESDEKLVVFTHHHDVTDQIAAALGEFGVLQADGRDSNEARQAAVDAFQRNASKRVIVCGMQSMAEGHTLTASSHVVFAELDWTPGKLAQAEDRLHRIGQHDSVLVQHIVLDGSLDGRMAELIVEKMQVITEAIG
jgi:SWI/SNF-related matrix-associated actin-dependent regulator 1 of chromatin subfamily A